MKLETKCLHAGYAPENGQPCALPIYQSTTYKYDSTDHVGALFDLSAPGHMYSRISNPTVAAVEEKIAALEGGIGALCTTSGQAANLLAVLNICSAGDSLVAVPTIYGGTINLFAVTLKRLGIECIFVDGDASPEEIRAAFKPNTRLVFGETIANPAISVFDIEKFAQVAHEQRVPLVVDNTFATPILCRPFAFGADIVTHSTTKYMDGHAIQVGGVIVDSGKFDWQNGRFPELTEPDESYHGVRYVRDFGAAAYITKARVQLMRDFGCYPGAQAAFYLNLGLETLPVRMERYCKNAEQMARFFAASDKVESVSYPALPGDPYHQLAQKYLPDGCSGVLSLTIKGGREAAVRFMDSLQLATNEVHVADIRTCVLHPASATHRQLTDAQLVAAGINPGLIRFSVGLEHIDDIMDDARQALEKV
ncbi:MULTISPECIES: O-acetylhomoserine aminocarboxypropyltransferase/cysteine synthase family protein [Eubacteriales]|uniref:Bifunctional O-acetylhomoserine aminocarboxypropyltransferase/cysteine synthase n=1 Tax=Bittarella massiliensis (ex Durand et al. 2017) TaxID=1720313 RepID=A0AAQ1MFB1_9FIRM|nr:MULTISPECIES: PLP-dependent transferase [Eubacteriales]ERI96366.1 O-acetylhomoserine aminocarboxypropyltransferase [Clostridium sp. ATCC 29733]MZL69809.1 bifunctional O-acetylhomoserine aminocarboxypropyltransferase/cysteine synthase [Bittarella massiliensis (ex Durand et al. 2017)]MZL80719.1 bifunctional O-acetylhomoserine aminocarboxypropyltransferase/cysteine synthase [Bittarella massiliensis (ex Durand et al. 2017)]SHG49148.1 O-acetylhomoserine (thiol)-lyase [Bittarella massiliensis (ex 